MTAIPSASGSDASTASSKKAKSNMRGWAYVDEYVPFEKLTEREKQEELARRRDHEPAKMGAADDLPRDTSEVPKFPTADADVDMVDASRDASEPTVKAKAPTIEVLLDSLPQPPVSNGEVITRNPDSVLVSGDAESTAKGEF